MDTAVEALAVSIGEKAKVDLEYMAGLPRLFSSPYFLVNWS